MADLRVGNAPGDNKTLQSSPEKYQVREQAKAMIQYLLDELQPKVYTKKKEALDTFEDYYFKNNPQLSNHDIKTLLLGTEQHKGLVHACGLISWKNFRLQTAAGKALGLLSRLLDSKENQNFQKFENVFLSINGTYYRNLRLTKHLREARGNKAAAHHLLLLLKEGGFDMTNLENDPPNKSPQRSAGLVDLMDLARIREKMSVFLGQRPNMDSLVQKGILKRGRVFGLSLAELEAAQQMKDHVPIALRHVCSHMTVTDAWQTQGIFRVSGDNPDIQQLQKAFDFPPENSPPGMNLPSLDGFSSHSLSGLVKLFFRLLPEPLVDYNRYEAFVGAFRANQKDQIKSLVTELPDLHQDTLNFLFDFLVLVSSDEKSNMMSISNLAIVFAPNLLRPRVETYEKVTKDTPAVIGTLTFLIEERRKLLEKEGWTVPKAIARAQEEVALFRTKLVQEDKPSSGDSAVSNAHSTSSSSCSSSSCSSNTAQPPPPPSSSSSSSSASSDPFAASAVSLAPPAAPSTSGLPAPPAATANSRARALSFGMDGPPATTVHAAPPAASHTPHKPPPRRGRSDSEQKGDRTERPERKSDRPRPPPPNANHFRNGSGHDDSPDGANGAVEDSGQSSAEGKGPAPGVPAKRSRPVSHRTGSRDDQDKSNVGSDKRHSAPPRPPLATLPRPPPSAKNEAQVATGGSSKQSMSDVQEGWYRYELQGSWEKSSSVDQKNTCGGCYPNFRTWRMNPQYRLALNGAEGEKTDVIIELHWKGNTEVTGEKRAPPPPLGMYVILNSGPSFHKVAVNKKEVKARTEFTAGALARKRITIHAFTPSLSDFLSSPTSPISPFPSHYILLPSTFQPDIPGNFSLVLHSARPDLLFQEVPRSLAWSWVEIRGQWTVETAGGCRNHPSWDKNPQYEISVSTKGSVIVVLAQESPADAGMTPIGFYVISPDPSKIMAKAAFMVAPEVHCTVELDPEHSFIVVPSTFEPGVQLPFHLSVFSPSKVSLIALSN